MRSCWGECLSLGCAAQWWRLWPWVNVVPRSRPRSYLGPRLPSVMEFFWENSGYKPLTIFTKKLHHSCLTGFQFVSGNPPLTRRKGEPSPTIFWLIYQCLPVRKFVAKNMDGSLFLPLTVECTWKKTTRT